MADRVYVLDTNIISQLRPERNPALWAQLEAHQSDTLCLCEPVIFEVERGYHHSRATRQLNTFRELLIPLFMIVTPRLADWQVAAKLWGDARRRGKQFSDVDVLLAAIAIRLDGILVTDDGDFAYLPLVQTENWLIDANDQ
jgi:predicted nucleic acid-binding protein